MHWGVIHTDLDFPAHWNGERILMSGMKVYNQTRDWARDQPDVRVVLDASIGLHEWRFFIPDEI